MKKKREKKVNKKSLKNSEIAISVKNVSKKFRIPHEKITSLRGAAVSVFRKKIYEEFKALDNVSFDVKRGEFFGIIGRNGSGKSTLLKILAKIYQADKGKVKIDGMVSPFLELGIGFNPELSGRDNIYLNATVLGMTKKEIDEKFDDIVKFSELERFIDQKLKNYSSGMSVRLAFSVSIHANRDILLMDEVLAVGDSNFQSKCLEEFNRYRDMGRTVVIVTHDINVVKRYCDKAMLLRNGKIVKIGKAEEVGNEYVYQNMSDEEKRMFDKEKQKIIDAEKNLKKLRGNEFEAEKKRIVEEKVKLEKEKKNKVAEITKVEFLDKDGNVKNVFKTGDDLSVRVYFKQNKKVSEKINFGIALSNQEKICLFGTNTFIDHLDTSNMKEVGFFQINYRDIQLKNDLYFITAGIWGVSVSHNYDYISNAASFRVFSKDQNIGIVNMKHNWNN